MLKPLIFKGFDVSYPLFLLSEKDFVNHDVLSFFRKKRENQERTGFDFKATL